MKKQEPFGNGIFRRAPYGAAAVLFLLLLAIWNTGRRAFVGDAGRSPGWDWFVAGYLVLIVVLSIVLPRALTRTREAKPATAVGSAADVVPFAVAMAPLLLAFCAAALGADDWTMTLALILSGLLLVIAARRTATRGA